MADLTFGVAIAVPEPYGSVLRERRASFGDPLADTVPSHITLLPPAPLGSDEIDCLASRIEPVAAATAPFDVVLRGTGTFRPVSPVVFVAVSQGISETELLADGLRASVGAAQAAFPFHPHVTVAHHLDDAGLDRAYDELAGFECAFTATEVALYLHDSRDGWIPHRAFPLAAARTTAAG